MFISISDCIWWKEDAENDMRKQSFAVPVVECAYFSCFWPAASVESIQTACRSINSDVFIAETQKLLPVFQAFSSESNVGSSLWSVWGKVTRFAPLFIAAQNVIHLAGKVVCVTTVSHAAALEKRFTRRLFWRLREASLKGTFYVLTSFCIWNNFFCL